MEFQYLNFKEAREKSGLSLEQVSTSTKIRPHILQAIEDGELSILPPTYIVSFVKTYAAFLKFPNDEIEYEIEQIRKKYHYQKPQPVVIPEIKEQEKEEKFSLSSIKGKISKSKQMNLIAYVIYSALGLALISLIYFSFFYSGSEQQTFKGEVGNIIDTTVIKSDKNADRQTAADTVILDARGIDSSWLRVNIDGVESEQILIEPGFEKTWNAKSFVILTIGKEGAIEFKRNGLVLPPFGPKGSVIRNVKITKDQIISSSAPWIPQKDSLVRKPVLKKKEKPEPPIRMLEPAEVKKSYEPFQQKKRR